MLDICDVDFICTTYVLNFERYSLILGMDWLAYCGANLDCDRRVVQLRSYGGRDLEILCTVEKANAIVDASSRNVVTIANLEFKQH